MRTFIFLASLILSGHHVSYYDGPLSVEFGLPFPVIPATAGIHG